MGKKRKKKAQKCDFWEHSENSEKDNAKQPLNKKGLEEIPSLFFIGASITLFTGKSIWYSGFRQVLFGLLAAAITYGIGHLIGVSVMG